MNKKLNLKHDLSNWMKVGFGSLVIMFWFTGQGVAANFYVSNSGSDSNPGTLASPFATVNKGINGRGAGDVIFLERGSVFREGGYSLNGGVTLKAYGNTASPLPVITGSTVATGFTPWTTNAQVQTANFTAGDVKQVFLNGQRLTLARTPNTGWLRTDMLDKDEFIRHNQIIDAALVSLPGAAPGRWVGANVRWRKWTWIYETRIITADNGVNQLELGGSTTLGLAGDDSGYYIDNSLAALDAPGEWYFDETANKLYVYPPAGTNTSTMVVEAAWRNKGMDVNGGTMEDVTVQHFDTGLQVNGASVLRRCVVQWISGNAIDGTWGSGGTLITGCTIRDILDNGINWINNPNGSGGTIFERNELTRIGSVPGLAGNGSWRGTGMALFAGPAMTIRLNRLTDIGYAGVLPGIPNVLIEKNVFIRCMATLNDGAAIYTNTNNTFIRENIILDTIGNLESSQPWFPLGHGIWPEFLEKFSGTQITDNTVYGSGGHGIWLPNNYNCTISGNTLVSNRLAALSLGGAEDEHATPADFQQNHTMQNNILAVGGKPWQPFAGQQILLQSWFTPKTLLLQYAIYEELEPQSQNRDLDYGMMSGTRMVYPVGLDLIKQEGKPNRVLTIPQWQSAEIDWADPSPVTNIGTSYLFINDTETSYNFALPAGITWQKLDGTAAGTSATIAPFRSVLLFATAGSTAGLSGYYLSSQAAPVSNALVTFRSTNGLAANGSQDALSLGGDGVKNLLKYAFNMIGNGTGQVPSLTTPNTAVTTATGTAGLPLVNTDGAGKLQVTFIRRKSTSNPGITYNVEFSDTLAAWASNPSATINVVNIDTTFERVIVTDNTSASKRFVRLRVTTP